MNIENGRSAMAAEKPVIISAKDVHKSFKLYYDKSNQLKDRLINPWRNRYEERKVLNGVNFEVREGEALGIIGENGCGKSTMLKLLTEIMYPDSGSINIKGRVSSLIELGAGFHIDLSGRENIYTNASIFGLSKKEIDNRLDDIVSFSELGAYIDNPIRTYSSGMYMRLAFSIAINVDADVLLIDEILAVGDANFQVKCFQKLREIKSKGTTIAIVSHDLGTIQSFCDKAIWLAEGHVAGYGDAKTTVESYRQYMNEKYLETLKAEEEKKANDKNKETSAIDKNELETDGQIAQEKENTENSVSSEIDYNSNRFGTKQAEITNVVFRDKDGKELETIIGNEPIDIDIFYEIHRPIEEYNFGMGFFTIENVCLYGVNTQYDGVTVKLDKDKGFIRFHMEKMPLLTGRFYFQCAVVDLSGVPLDYFRKYCDFSVKSNVMAIGCFNVEHRWEVH